MGNFFFQSEQAVSQEEHSSNNDITFEISRNIYIGDGDIVSSEPSRWISIADPDRDFAVLKDANQIVIDRSSIHILYNYPLIKFGPSDNEQQHKGWIFEEISPNGKCFTRFDLVKVISNRYHQIYQEERETSQVPEKFGEGVPKYNRSFTEGKYGIYGHIIGDLQLNHVTHDAAHDLYILSITS
jgi:hypothetical protein